jgi:SAM-dependent methyltransferase
VLDVACGTGIVARTAADRTGAAGVVGVDLNEAMLTVARRVRPDLDWRQGDVEALPLPDESFEVVLCQMALMFFPDRAKALREMSRVATHGGTVAVLVPADLADQPAYGPLVDVIARHAGADARELLDTYFACGDLDQLIDLFDKAGLHAAITRTIRGTLRSPSVEAAVATEMNSTPLGQRITPAVVQRIVAESEQVLAPFITPDGALEAPFDCHIATATRR